MAEENKCPDCGHEHGSDGCDQCECGK